MPVFFDRQDTIKEGSVLVRAAESGESKELGRVPARFSTRLADRHGTVFLPSAYLQDLDTFRANPVMFFNHNAWSLPLGRIDDLRVDDYALSGVAVFDMDDARAAEIAGKYHRGFMRGFSVRIRALAAIGDWSPEEHVKTLPADLQKMLRDGDIWAVVTRAMLLEISACGIPSNPDTLAENRTEMLIDFDPGLKAMSERMQALEQELASERAARADLEAAFTFARTQK